MQQPLTQSVPAGQWLPDLPDINNPGCTVALNCISQGESYAPINTLTASGAPLPDKCRGAIAVKAMDGTVAMFAGTATKLYRLVGNTWTDASRAGDYSTPADGRWVFAIYGNIVIADNYADEKQQFLIGTDTEFSDIANAPKCRVTGVVNNFVVCGDTFDVDGSRQNRLRWCAIDDPTDWTVNPTGTGADLQDLPTGGAVRAIVGFDNHAIIVQEREIRRMEYTGGTDIFSISVAEPVRGATCSGSVVNIGNSIFYLSEDGFYMFGPQGSVPIGANKVDKWFYKNMRGGTESKIVSGFNPLLKIVVWAFVSAESTDGEPDRLLVYNWQDQRWTLVYERVQQILVALSASKGLEDLAAIYGSLENIPFGLDSSVWAGGRILPAAFMTTNALGYFNGDAMEATIEGGEARLNQNGRTFASALFVNSDAPSASVSVGSRNSLTEAVTYTSPLLQSRTGEFTCRVDATFHRFRVILSGAWSYFQGVQYRAKAKGI